MSDRKHKVELDNLWFGFFIMVCFLMLFWHTKIDCAIGVDRACEIISDSYAEVPK